MNVSIPFTEKADEHGDQPHFAFTLTYSRLSGGSVVKIEVHIGKISDDVGKIVIDVGIAPHPLNKCVISLHRKGCSAPPKVFQACQNL